MKGAKEFTGRNLDEAIEAACSYYDLPREKLEIEIVNDAKSGIFGLVGAKKATVLAKQTSLANYADLASREEKDEGRTQNERGQAQQRQPKERRPRRNEHNTPQAADEANSAPETSASTSENTDVEPAAHTSPRRPERSSDREKTGDREKSGRGRSHSGAHRSREHSPERHEAQDAEGQRSNQGSTQAPARRPQRDSRRSDRRSQRKPDHAQAFESENPFEQNFNSDSDEQFNSLECAMDFESQSNLKSLDEIDQNKAIELVQSALEQLLKPICAAPEIKVAIEDRRIEASINCEDESGLIIGREGQTLAALQYMVSRIISRQMEAAVHVHLDTGDYKERQDQKLKELALRLADRARESGRTQYTRPLSSYHRRIVHMVLQNEESIETRSRGDGAMKRVYIFMRQERI